MAGREGSPGPLRYRLWCGGLYKDITEDEIRQRVEPFADVIKVMLRSSVKDTFCFIQFRSQKDMDIAREKLDQSNLLGDRVCAQPATADKKKDGGPPVYESRRPPKAEGMGKGGGKDKGSDYGRRPRSRTPAGHDDRHGGKGNQKPRYQDGPRGPHAGEGRSDRRRDDGPGMPRPDSREARRPDPQWELRDAGGRGPRGDRREDRGREDYRVEDFRKESFRREDFRRDDFRRDDFRREDFPRDDRRDDPRRDEPRRRDDYRRDDFRQEDFRRPPPGREEPPREPRRDDRRDDFRREDHRRGAAAPRREEIRAPDPRGPDPRREDYRRDGPRREERPERERERSHRDLREPRADLPAPRGDRGDRVGDRGGYRYDDQRRGDDRRASGHEYQGRATRDPPREPPRDANPPREYDSGPGSFRKVREVYESKVPLGRHKITVENLPEDMTWVEFKDLGKDFGSSITFARTFQVNGVNRGMLEYQDRADADNAIRELDDRRVEGSNLRLRAYYAPEGRGS